MGCQNSHQVIEGKNQSAQLPKEIEKVISQSKFDQAEKQGDELFKKGEILKAIAVYQKIIQANYIHDYDIQGLGNLEHAVGRYEGAIYKWYDDSKQKRNLKGNPYDALSLCYCALRGKFDEELKQGITWYEEMLSEIESYQLYMGYANILSNNRKYKEAIKVYNKIILLKPTLINAHISIFLLNQFKLKHHLEAEGMAKKLIGLYPENMYAKFILSKGNKDPVGQLSDLKELSQKHPDYARIFFEIASIYERKQDNKEAISWYKKSIDVLPEYAESYYNIGLNLEICKQKEEAISWYMKACERKPELKSPFLRLVELYDNLAYDEDKIEAEINKFSSLDRFTYYYELGMAYYQSKKVDESLKWYQKAEKLNASSFKLLNAMGMSFDEKQDFVNGQAYYLHCIQENPKFPDVYYNLTILYNNKKEEKKAKQCYLKAIRLNPHYSLANNNSGNNKRHLRPLKSLQSKQNANIPLLGSGFKKLLEPLPNNYRSTQTAKIHNSDDFLKKSAVSKNVEEDDDFYSKVTEEQKEILQVLYEMFKSNKPQGINETKDELEKIIKQIHSDEFSLSHISEIYESIKIIYKKDEQYFHILPIILVQYYQEKVINHKISFESILSQINIALQTLIEKRLQKNNSAGKVSQIEIKMKHFQFREDVHINLIRDANKIKDYQSLCRELYEIKEEAEKYLSQFIDLIEDVRKRSNGVEFIARTRIPRDQGKVFRYRLQLTQQMFREDLGESRCAAFIQRIAQALAKAGRQSAAARTVLVEAEWGREVSAMLAERKKAGRAFELGVGDLLRGRVVFATVEELARGLEVTDNICFLRGYEVLGLSNRLADRAHRDVLLTVRVQEAVCEFRLELRHEDRQPQPELLELSSCPLGALIGSCALLSQPVSYPLTDICRDIIQELSDKPQSNQLSLKAAKYVLQALTIKQ